MKKTVFLALSLALVSTPLSYAQEPMNTIQDGHIVQGGTYFNTADGKTTFINSGGGGLWVQNGTNVRGLEVDTQGQQTNNGGNFLFSAPGNVVRVDGNIDVNAIQNGQGAFLGNGGKVLVDSAYLFQSGNIFANGLNGGHVQMNVDGMTMTPNAKVEARGTDGNGGVIWVNATGSVDFQKNASLDTSGTGLPGMHSNHIIVFGSLINNDGILKANSVSVSAGGKIELAARGETSLTSIKNAISNTDAFTANEKNVITVRLDSLASNHNRDIVNTGLMQANGGNSGIAGQNGGSGGEISVIATHDILNSGGIISADGGKGNASSGGNGGKITFKVNLGSQQGHAFNNDGTVSAVGGLGNPAVESGSIFGGNGGQITMVEGEFLNGEKGRVTADGGFGGKSGATTGGLGGFIQFESDSQFKDLSRNSGIIDAYGGYGGDSGKGGQGGAIILKYVNNSGLIQVDGGGGLKGGQGGSIRLTNLTDTGTVLSDGGYSYGTSLLGVGGQAGVIVLDKVLHNGGTLSVNGGSGLGSLLKAIPSAVEGRGGDGGTITLLNGSTNGGLIEADGGRGRTYEDIEARVGGNGGHIVLNGVTNSNLIRANGGNLIDPAVSVTNKYLQTAGNGGLIEATAVTNGTTSSPSAVLQSNGGDGGQKGNGGNGGTFDHNGGIRFAASQNNANGLVQSNGGKGLNAGKGGDTEVSNKSANTGSIENRGGQGILTGGDGGTISLNASPVKGQLSVGGGNATDLNGGVGGSGGTVFYNPASRPLPSNIDINAGAPVVSGKNHNGQIKLVP